MQQLQAVRKSMQNMQTQVQEHHNEAMPFVARTLPFFFFFSFCFSLHLFLLLSPPRYLDLQNDPPAVAGTVHQCVLACMKVDGWFARTAWKMATRSIGACFPDIVPQKRVVHNDAYVKKS